MSQYLVAVQLPDNYNPSPADAGSMGRDIAELNEEMVAVGVRVFVGGLTSAKEAKSLRAQADGKVLTTDGPYLETKEHIAVFGCSRSPAWKMRRRGGARQSSPAECQWKSARSAYQRNFCDTVKSAKTRRSGGKACLFFEIYD